MLRTETQRLPAPPQTLPAPEGVSLPDPGKARLADLVRGRRPERPAPPPRPVTPAAPARVEHNQD